MPEAEVLYSDIKFKRGRGNEDEATPSTAEPTYSEVKISKAHRPAEHASSRRSGVTWERVALLVLSVFLVAALTALGVTQNLSKTEPCKVEQPTQPPSVRGETCPRCEDGWEPHEGKRYFFSSVNLNWTQSRRQCISMRGDLVVIKTKEEQEFLQSRLSAETVKPEDKFWIGLTDSEKEREWLWLDNTTLDTSLKFRSKYCVMMGKKKDKNLKILFLKSCESSQKYICEKPEEAGA